MSLRPVRGFAVTSAGLLALTLAACTGTSDPRGAATQTAATSRTASPSASATPSATATTTGDAAAACVGSTFEALSDDQRLGQLLMVGFDTSGSLDSLDALVSRSHVGNVIYLGGWEGADRVTRTSAHLQGLVSQESTGHVGLLVAADQEGGVVHQLRGDGFTRPPSAKAQAEMTPAELTRAARAWGEELKDAGVNVNLAPVADTVPKAIGRANEPIGKWGRQYGSTPRAVSRASTAFLEGMLEGGVQGTLKHFPGLGRIRSNTDFSATGITDTVATKDDPFLRPFADGIAAGAGLVMVASARYPKLDPRNPAVFSEAIVTGLLRQQMHYDGVVVTDDVNARALRDVAPGERARRVLSAGGDVVLTGAASDAGEMLEALAEAAEDDPAMATKIDDAVVRVLTLKERMGLLPCSSTAS